MKYHNFPQFLFGSLFPVTISLTCSFFVAVKIYDCISKYASEPQTNTVEMKSNDGLPYPTITICPNWFGSGLNKEHIKKCGIGSTQDYDKGHWIGNCSDPGLLYETTVKPFDELISGVRFYTKDGIEWKNHTIYKPIDSLYGRCYSVFPAAEAKEKGIVELLIKTEHKHIIVHVSSPGEFLTGNFG